MGSVTLCCDRAFVPRRRISHPLIITNSREIHIFVEFDCNIMDCNRSLRDGHALLSYINIPSSSCNFQGFLLTRENLLKDRNLGSQQVSLALIPVIVLTSLSEIKKRNNFNDRAAGEMVSIQRLRNGRVIQLQSVSSDSRIFYTPPSILRCLLVGSLRGGWKGLIRRGGTTSGKCNWQQS